MNTVRSNVIQGFQHLYDAEPEGVWSAPGRVNLIGEHTDYNNGFVFPFAINRRTYVALGRRTDSVIRVSSTFSDEVITIELSELSPENVTGWSAYPLGVAWALGQFGANLNEVIGVDLYIDSQVPIGAGLSSSAAIESAVAMALNDVWKLHYDKRKLALVGQLAENKAVGAPTGIMDQSASLLGRRDAGVFLDCQSMQAEVVPLGFEEAKLELLVVDTKVKHSHATGGYAKRRASCELAAKTMGVKTLRDLSVDDLPVMKEKLDDETFRRARHVITENDRVLKVIKLMHEGKTTEIGDLLVGSHESMRDDFEISVPELNLAVETSLAYGAIGARMTGGGFGGAAIALVPLDKREALESEILKAFKDAGFTKPDLFVVHATNGASMDQDYGAGLLGAPLLEIDHDDEDEDDDIEELNVNPIELRFTNAHHSAHLVITGFGATLRTLKIDGIDVIEGFAPEVPNQKSAGDILIPWPNRVRDGVWNFNGEQFQLEVNETERNNALHGLLRDIPHRVLHRALDSVTLRAYIEPSKGYPFSLTVDTTYELNENGVVVRHNIHNDGNETAPVAVGSHPYVKIAGTPTEDLVLTLKAKKRVVVDDRLNPIDIEPVKGTRYDLNNSATVGTLDLDTAYCDLVPDEDGYYRHTIEDAKGHVLCVWGDSNFRHAQVYTTDSFNTQDGPGWAVAVEPTTAPPDAFNSQTDLYLLDPGANWECEWGISLNTKEQK